MELDFSFGIKNIARFRANIFNQRGATAAVLRVIPFEIMSFKQLGLPAVLEKLCEKPRGLILITGPTGSGKSTTLAAMLDKINAERWEHMITIEDLDRVYPPTQEMSGQPARGACRYTLLPERSSWPLFVRIPISC